MKKAKNKKSNRMIHHPLGNVGMAGKNIHGCVLIALR
jgi:hypothetical protein